MAEEEAPLLALENPIENGDFAVAVSGLRHSFGSSAVMNDFNMTVQRGTIYGLLGPSGCGKTTLLRMLLGQLMPDEGSVRVLGTVPGSTSLVPGSAVGYAPQEIALYKELTVAETLRFHSKLHHMHWNEYEERKRSLIEFLHLPDESRLVSDLSGGQQRRLSLAVALLHQPALLILDEPTVGVDPELREQIWSYLRELSQNEGVTVIITTHYIEEAACSDRIGLMRNGRLLVEDAPQSLLQRYQVATLEELFLNLCKRGKPANRPQETFQVDSIQQSVGASSLPPKAPELPLTPTTGRQSARRSHGTSTVAIESAQRQRRDCFQDAKAPAALPWELLHWFSFVLEEINFASPGLAHLPHCSFHQILNPAVQIILLGLAVGTNPHDLHFGIVNKDIGVFDPISNSTLNVGAMYVSTLTTNYSRTFVLHIYSDLQNAIDMVHGGSVWGVAYINENFSLSLTNRTKAIPYGANIQLYMDMSNMEIASMLISSLTSAYGDTISAAFSPAEGTPPVVVMEAVYGKIKSRYIDFLAPGMLAMVCFGFGLLLTAVSFTTERTTMTLDRLFASGVRSFEIVWGNQLAMTAVFVIQLTVLLLITYLIFHLPLHLATAWVFLLMFALGFVSLCVGMLIAAVSNGEFEAVQYSFAVFFPLQLTSGILWPSEAMPRWLYWAAQCMPTTWVAEALRAVMIKGWGITHRPVYLAFCITMGAALLLFGASVLSVKPPAIVGKMQKFSMCLRRGERNRK